MIMNKVLATGATTAIFLQIGFTGCKDNSNDPDKLQCLTAANTTKYSCKIDGVENTTLTDGVTSKCCNGHACEVFNKTWNVCRKTGDSKYCYTDTNITFAKDQICDEKSAPCCSGFKCQAVTPGIGFGDKSCVSTTDPEHSGGGGGGGKVTPEMACVSDWQCSNSPLYGVGWGCHPTYGVCVFTCNQALGQTPCAQVKRGHGYFAATNGNACCGRYEQCLYQNTEQGACVPEIRNVGGYKWPNCARNTDCGYGEHCVQTGQVSTLKGVCRATTQIYQGTEYCMNPGDEQCSSSQGDYCCPQGYSCSSQRYAFMSSGKISCEPPSCSRTSDCQYGASCAGGKCIMSCPKNQQCGGECCSKNHVCVKDNNYGGVRCDYFMN